MSDPIIDEPTPVDTLESGTVYNGRVWDVVSERFRYNDEVLTRDFITHPGAVAVMAFDDQDRFVTIKQYRHPVRLREWEIPAGLLDLEGEHPLASAQRELAEEVDLAAATWHVLADYCTSPGGSDEAIRVYIARDLAPAVHTFERTGEEADMVVRWISLDDAVDAVLDGRVSNSIFQIAVLTALASRDRGWSTLRPGDAPWPQVDWRDARRI
ncbi:MAG: NUDIX domain-containing protein [Microbacteriaceae bacterium]